MYKIIKVGIATLILGWWLAHPAWAANPQTSDIIGGSAADFIMDMINIGRMFNPANNNLSPTNNTFIGFQSQGNCTSAQGFNSEVPGGQGLPCVPNTMYPPFGAGLTIQTGMTSTACAFRAGIASSAIQHTVVVSQQTVNPQSGVTFAGGPVGRIQATGGICFPTGSGFGHFAGWLQGKFYLSLFDHLPDVMCAFLMNMRTGPASCGPYH